MRSVSVGRRPGHHLVEQQQLRVGRERARDLEPLAVGQRQRRGALRALVEEIEPLAARRGACARAAATSGWRSSAPMTTLSSTVSAGNGRTIWKVRPMPRRQIASGASPSIRSPANAIAPVVGREHAGDHVEQRGLAGAVRTDDGEDLAGATSKLTLVDRHAGRGSACSRASTASSARHRRRALRRGRSSAREPRPHAARPNVDDHHQGEAVEQRLDAGRIDAEPLPVGAIRTSPSGVRMKAPTTGPNTVPSPPTIGARISSIERPMSNTCAGKQVVVVEGVEHAADRRHGRTRSARPSSWRAKTSMPSARAACSSSRTASH